VASGGVVTAGPTYNYSYDGMYRLSGMTDSNNNNIVNNVSYNTADQLLTMNYPAANEVRGCVRRCYWCIPAI